MTLPYEWFDKTSRTKCPSNFRTLTSTRGGHPVAGHCSRHHNFGRKKAEDLEWLVTAPDAVILQGTSSAFFCVLVARYHLTLAHNHRLLYHFPQSRLRHRNSLHRRCLIHRQNLHPDPNPGLRYVGYVGVVVVLRCRTEFIINRKIVEYTKPH